MPEHPPPLPIPPLNLLDGASLMLDFDGTLVEIASRPDLVVVDPALVTLLRRLSQRLDGRIALVSGRPLRELSAFFGADSFAMAGSHGLEMRWPDGRAWSPPPPAGLRALEADARSLASRNPGVLVEMKPYGLALHYRQAPQAAQACHDLARRVASRDDLTLQTGKMVVELRARGADKGVAVETLMQTSSISTGRPVAVGDDDTDEAAFAAAQRLSGVGVLVGDMRPTAASYRLQSVSHALRWLDASCTAAS